MARRRRQEEEKPDLGFEIPDFDEDEFIRKETISFRTTLILFLYSVVTAAVSFLIWINTGQVWGLALLVGLALGVALRWMYGWLKVDIEHFGKKEWTGTGLLYFFSWLAFFIFLTNPPLYDGVAPELEVHITPDAQVPGSAVTVTLVAFDNVRVDPDAVSFEVQGPSGRILGTTDDLVRHDEHKAAWQWTFTPTNPGTYTVTASIEDVETGVIKRDPRTQTHEATFEVGDILEVFLSNGGDFTSPDDTVRVEFPASIDVYRAYLQPENTTAETDRIHLEHDTDRDEDTTQVWRARAEFDGFDNGTNNFTVHIVEHESYYLAAKYGIPAIDAPLASSDTYTVTIDDPALLGEFAAKAPKARDPSVEQVPGLGTAAMLATLGLALWVGQRQRRRPTPY